jgi:hypothetical protein
MFAICLSSPALADWQTYANPDFGYSIRYPAHLFEGSVPDKGGLTLYTADRRALLFIFGGRSETGENARQLANGLEELPDIYRVTYRRITPKWFVLSGYLAGSGDIFYERVELSSKGRFLSGFRLEYPVSQRAIFDHLIGRIGRSLTPPARG